MLYKLSANENPFGTSLAVKKVIQTFQDMHLYPDPTAMLLRQKISQVFDLDLHQMMCGCGSEDLLVSIFRTFLNHNDHVIIPKYGFCVYDIISKIIGSSISYSGYDDDMRLRPEDILSNITSKTKLICFDHPGNPIGTYLLKNQLHKLLDQIPSHIPVVLDTAYAEYLADDPHYDCGLTLLEQFPNLIVTRSFSKAYGLAGLRLGWLAASKEILGQLNKNRLLFKTTAISQQAGIAALSDMDFIKTTVEHTKKWRIILEKKLDEKNLLKFKSSANFAVARFPDEKSAIEWVNNLKEKHQISVLRLTQYNLPRDVRISIGDGDAMAKLLEAI